MIIKNIKGKLYQHIPTGKIEKVVYADDDCVTLYDKSRYSTCSTVDFLKFWKPYEAPNDKVIDDMETKINEEYLRILTQLEDVRNHCNLGAYVDYLDKAIVAVRALGTRPVLSDNIEQFMSITQDMTKTYAAKNHDYGNSFEESLDEFGLVASVVRLGDKMNRTKSLIKKEAQVKDESIKDTLLDMANYAIMTVMWMNKNQKV